MSSGPAGPTARDPFWILLILLPPLLLLPNLGDSLLWQDEAETALLGRAVAIHGIPRAHDGRQVITDQPGVDVNEDGVWIWSSWLQHYLVAASFRTLGESTTSARLPFVLAAWLALLLAYAVLRDLSRDRFLARMAVFLLLFSVPFLLHARQARYYPLLTAFSLLHLWGYWRLVQGKPRGGLLLVLGGVGLYQSFIPQLVASTLALAAHALFVQRDRRVVRSFLLGCGVVALLTLPLFVYTQSWSRDYGGQGYGFESPMRALATLRGYLLLVHVYGWPFLLALPWAWRRLGSLDGVTRHGARAALVVGAGGWLLAMAAAPSPLSFWTLGLLSVAGAGAGLAAAIADERARLSLPLSLPSWKPLVGLVVVTSVGLVVALSPSPYYRYLLGVLPLLALATAATLRAVVPSRRAAAVGLAIAVIAVDTVQWGPFGVATRISGPARPLVDYDWNLGERDANTASSRVLGHRAGRALVRSDLAAYGSELTGSYTGPLESILPVLREQSRPGDTLATTYEHFPLQFYTDLRVVRTDWLEEGGPLPEWVWLHGVLRNRVEPWLRQALETRYERVAVDGADDLWENTPEPTRHRFTTPSDGRPLELYRLRSADEPAGIER